MGHDMLLFNKKGTEIGYLRFSMWDRTSDVIYSIFNVEEFNGYVSGKGEQKTFSTLEVEKAFQRFLLEKKQQFTNSNNGFTTNRQQEIERFMFTCQEAVHKDGEVTIYFG